LSVQFSDRFDFSSYRSFWRSAGKKAAHASGARPHYFLDGLTRKNTVKAARPARECVFPAQSPLPAACLRLPVATRPVCVQRQAGGRQVHRTGRRFAWRRQASPPFAKQIPPPPPFAKGGDGGICSTAGVIVEPYVNGIAPSPSRSQNQAEYHTWPLSHTGSAGRSPIAWPPCSCSTRTPREPSQ